MNDCFGNHFDHAAKTIVDLCHQYYEKGYLPATSGNFSMRLSDECCAITTSGKDKGTIQVKDIMCVGMDGRPQSAGNPSAETALHVSLYRLFADANIVLHTHSCNATVLSRIYDKELLTLSGYELLKAFDGVDDHKTALLIPIFENTQNISSLAREVERCRDRGGLNAPAYLIRGHGLYVWGQDIQQVTKLHEALEFLFACELDMLKCTN